MINVFDDDASVAFSKSGKYIIVNNEYYFENQFYVFKSKIQLKSNNTDKPVISLNNHTLKTWSKLSVSRKFKRDSMRISNNFSLITYQDEKGIKICFGEDHDVYYSKDLEGKHKILGLETTFVVYSKRYTLFLWCFFLDTTIEFNAQNLHGRIKYARMSDISCFILVGDRKILEIFEGDSIENVIVPYFEENKDIYDANFVNIRNCVVIINEEEVECFNFLECVKIYKIDLNIRNPRRIFVSEDETKLFAFSKNFKEVYILDIKEQVMEYRAEDLIEGLSMLYCATFNNTGILEYIIMTSCFKS